MGFTDPCQEYWIYDLWRVLSGAEIIGWGGSQQWSSNVEYGVCFSVDSIRLNLFESVALPMMKYRTSICYKDSRNCTTQSRFGSRIELTPQQFSYNITISRATLVRWVWVYVEINIWFYVSSFWFWRDNCLWNTYKLISNHEYYRVVLLRVGIVMAFWFIVDEKWKRCLVKNKFPLSIEPRTNEHYAKV